jgi:glycosyltransferase involved in cell wall biosynthesis
MFSLTNPQWVKELLQYHTDKRISEEEKIAAINERLDKITSDNPLISIVIPAYNEASNLLPCIDSLSRLQTAFPLEIIVVNNNSTDRTQELLDRLHVVSVLETIQSIGAARQRGLLSAKGEYIFSADADCLYPTGYLEILMKYITQPSVSCAFGRYAFWGDATVPRWQYELYEWLKWLPVELKNLNRPFLNAMGGAMAFKKVPALAIGYDVRPIVGEDGRMAFDLMKYGRLVYVRHSDAVAWTSARALFRDGSFGHALVKRVWNYLQRLPEFFSPLPDHDTKSSQNKP